MNTDTDDLVFRPRLGFLGALLISGLMWAALIALAFGLFS